MQMEVLEKQEDSRVIIVFFSLKAKGETFQRQCFKYHY